MRKLKEVLRLRYELGLGQRQIARSCSIGHGTVYEYLKRAEAAGVTWPLPDGWDDRQLEAALFRETPRRACETHKPPPDFAQLHEELQRHPHLTLQLAWEEYRQAHPDGYAYSRFCELYQRWRQQLDMVLRQEQVAGEKLLVDYAGATIPIHDPQGAPERPAAIFVAVLGASNYTYAEATASQELENWIGSHIHAFEFLGGAPKLVIPDNTRTGVNRACRYEPDLNRTYHELAMHYGVGPRAQDVEALQALERTTGAPRFVYDTPQHYFDTVILPVSDKLPVVKECIRPVETQYKAPDGGSWCISYASPASLRGPYRQALNLLLSAEKFDTFGTYCQRKPFYPRVDFHEAWKRLLELNDHNMLTANSRVYEDLDEKLKFIFREGQLLLNQGLEYVGARVDTTGPGIPVMVYNPVSWSRTGLVEATVRFMEPVKDFDVRDLRGRPLLMQKLGSDEQKREWRVLALLRDVPSLGYTLIRAIPGKPYAQSSPVRASAGMLENEYLKVTLDRTGTVTSLYDEISKRETLAGPANLLGLFKEDLGASDSYALQLTSQKERFEPMGAQALVESGSVRAVVRSRFRSEDSQFTVDTILEAGSPRVEFAITADWHDRDKALLADFPVRMAGGTATFEKPYGFEETSPDGQRQCAQQWIDLSTDAYGVSLLNAGLYEFYAKKNVLRAALLRGTRDMNARMDEGTRSFHYALYPHVRGWKDADTVRQAAELNTPMVAKQEPHHAGTLTGWGSASNPAYPPEHSFLSLTPKNVVVTAVKMSEDPWGPDELVLRLQETAGRPAEGELSLAFTVTSGEETNLIEEPTGNKLQADGGRVHFNIRPRQIKTLKLKLRARGW